MAYVLKWVGGDCGDNKVWLVEIKRGLDGNGRRFTEATWTADPTKAKTFGSREKAQAENTWPDRTVRPVPLSEALAAGAAS